MKFLPVIIFSIILICSGYSTYGCVPPNKPPIALFTYSPPKPRTFESILFNASASYDPEGLIASYAWNFGDGNATQVSNPIIYHSYEEPGTYNVTLTVADSAGLKNATSKEITITKPPFAAFTYSPLHPRAGQDVVFNASESRPNGGYIVGYFWDFLDNVTENTSDPIVAHVYDIFGNYSVTLTVTDSEGETAVAIRRLTVIAPPKADFFFEPLQPHVFDLITFNASNSVPNGGFLVEFRWDFGDGSEVKFGMIVQHKYAKMGEYTVSLNVTDSEGEWDTKQITVKVLPHIADLNEDGKVDIQDLHIWCRAYGSYPSHGRWNPKADINHDGKVDILDAVIIARSFYQ